MCSLPSKIDLGAVSVGARTPAQQINVTNDGSASLTINSVQVAGSDFVVANNHCTPGAALGARGQLLVRIGWHTYDRGCNEGDGGDRHVGRAVPDSS